MSRYANIDLRLDRGASPVQITASCVAGFGVLPLLHFIPLAVSPSSRRSSVVRSSIIAAATSSQTVGSMAMV